MIRRAVTTGAEVVLILLASYTFFFVNIGRKTPYDHLAAILSTQPAQEAAEDLAGASKQLKDKALKEAGQR